MQTTTKMLFVRRPFIAIRFITSSGNDRLVIIDLFLRLCLYYQLQSTEQNMYVLLQGRPQDLGGGGAKKFFFQIWEFACREATCCAWRSHAHC